MFLSVLQPIKLFNNNKKKPHARFLLVQTHTFHGHQSGTFLHIKILRCDHSFGRICVSSVFCATIQQFGISNLYSKPYCEDIPHFNRHFIRMIERTSEKNVLALSSKTFSP